MYRDTNRQSPLFGVDSTLSSAARRRLESSWAHRFLRDVFPILLEVESSFAHLYGTTGKPNWSVARLLSVLLLKELEDLTDEQAVDALTFDARWRYALGFEADEDSYLSRQALVEFRSRIVREDPEAEILTVVFHRVTAQALHDLGVSTSRQRIDSSLIQSNIRQRARIDLLLTTLRHALVAVQQRDAAALDALSAPLKAWFEGKEEGRGWFGDTGPRVALQQIGEWLFEVVRHFGADEVFAELEALQLAARALEEHFEFDPDPGPGPGKTRIKARKHAVKVNHPTTLQSPHDPDAGQGHKGQGYMLHIVETCANSTTELITAFKLNPANQADQNQAVPLIDELSSHATRPDVLYADAGYITPISLQEAATRGTRLDGPVPVCDGFDRLDFQYADNGHIRSCPAGQAPIAHRERKYEDDPDPVAHAFFDADICNACDHRTACPARQKQSQVILPLVRRLVVRDELRRAQKHDEWWEEYAIRSGIEATFSELKRAHGCRRLRVRRRARVKLSLTLKILACNVKRWNRAA